jgi:hypothetical protein
MTNQILTTGVLIVMDGTHGCAECLLVEILVPMRKTVLFLTIAIAVPVATLPAFV